eukprot:Phypoly_transcript_05792.p1 GENE.Phypoly_transcript_05792~~Phypoly_transcript_05792.p1  ORF type:complete len:619 (+),score=138.83 Phypoly_transcript_05792:19-1875(+)
MEVHALKQALVRPTSDEEKALDDLAREVLMVDENNDSLIPGFKDILRKGITPLPADVVKRDVLIIGAGIAGLLAGKILDQAGYNVTILEAHHSRVGGRIKTFIKTKTHGAPFLDEKLYAEAGAMRIPSAHPLVNELIDVENLTDKKRPFYNSDVDRFHPFDTTAHAEPVRRTRVHLNSHNVSRAEYESGELADKSLGFGVVIEKTADELLKYALRKPDRLVDPKKSIEEQIEGWKKIITEYDDKSMREYLLHYFRRKLKKHPHLLSKHENNKATIATQVETIIQYIGTLQNLTSRLFLSFFHSFIDTMIISPENVYYELAGGNWQLPYAVYEHVKEDVVTNARVVNLHFNGQGYARQAHKGRDGVWVRANSDYEHKPLTREFTADYALVTIPFSALRIVSTVPAFSLSKRRAIMELHYDSATKVLLEFTQRWWEFTKEEWERKIPDPYRGHSSFGGYTTTDIINRFIYFPSHKTEGSTGGVILASYVWSDEANRWDSMTMAERYQVALDGLAEIYGNGIKRFYSGEGKTQSWMQDPYAMGEAAVFSPGQAHALHPHIKDPEGNVFFAGEHASLKHAWLEGAIETAIRAVLQIHKKVLIESQNLQPTTPPPTSDAPHPK